MWSAKTHMILYSRFPSKFLKKTKLKIEIQHTSSARTERIKRKNNVLILFSLFSFSLCGVCLTALLWGLGK